MAPNYHQSTDITTIYTSSCAFTYCARKTVQVPNSISTTKTSQPPGTKLAVQTTPSL